MIWPATHGHFWRSGPACEVSLDGAQLRARRGARQWDFDLATSDARHEFHHWGLCRGTALRIAAEGRSLVIGGEGYVSPELEYAAPIETGPDLILPSSHFRELVARLPAGPDRGAKARTYWLWDNGTRPLAAFRPVLYAFVFLLAAGTSVRVAPMALGIGVALACVVGITTLEVRRMRRLASPPLCLTIDDERLSVANADPGASPGQWPIRDLTIRSSRWRAPPSGRAGATAILDMPAIIVEGALPRPLSIGALTLWAGTNGPSTRPPRYLVSPPCWPSLAAALLAKQPLPAAADPA